MIGFGHRLSFNLSDGCIQFVLNPGTAFCKDQVSICVVLPVQ